MPAASNTPAMLVEHAMIVEKAGTVASTPASIKISRAMLLQVRLGTTLPHTAKSGLPPLSSPTMCLTTGTDIAMASSPASGPSTLAKGVRTPAASQMVSAWGGVVMRRRLLNRAIAPTHPTSLQGCNQGNAGSPLVEFSHFRACEVPAGLRNHLMQLE